MGFLGFDFRNKTVVQDMSHPWYLPFSVVLLPALPLANIYGSGWQSKSRLLRTPMSVGCHTLVVRGSVSGSDGGARLVSPSEKIAPYRMDNLFFGIPLCKGLPSEAFLKIISVLCN